MNIDGSNQARLTNTAQEESQPAWSWDKNRIAYVAYTPSGAGDEYRDIMVMAAGGSGSRSLTFGADQNDSPAWSPDGSQIAFSKLGSGTNGWDLYVMDAVTGAKFSPLTRDTGGDVKPSWSPDGTKIAYVRSYQGYQSDVTIINADGTNPIRVTHGGIAQEVCWDPDGTHLVYTANGGIFRIGVDGTNTQILTYTGGEPDCR